jgi:hypothetical protein
MKKYSQLISIWPQIYQKLKNPPIGVNLGNFPSKLPPLHKIIIEPGKLLENSQAIGYVSTEDVDNNGVLDTIHISSPRLEEAFRGAGVSLESAKNLNQLSNDELVKILTPFVELLSHEIGHLNDYNPNQTNPFPGGESVAETAARNAVAPISTTNKKSSFAKGSASMKLVDLQVLVTLANKLDQLGHHNLSNHVDDLIKKCAQDASEPDLQSPVDVRTPLNRMKEGLKGQIRPKGDPYTYNFDSKSKTFTIVTVPLGKENLIDHVIKPGQGGYEQLMLEAKKMGLEKEKPEVQLTERTEFIYPEPSEITEDRQKKILVKKLSFEESVKNFVNQIAGSIQGQGQAQQMLESNLSLIKNMDGHQIYDFFNKRIMPLLVVSVGQERVDAIQTALQAVMSSWSEVEALMKSKPTKNFANDKTAELTNLFLIKQNNPFFRTNEKFTR